MLDNKKNNPPCIKLNIDGLQFLPNAASGLSFRNWDSKGRFLFAGLRKLGSLYAIQADALAVREGFLCAQDRGYLKILLKGKV